VLAEFIPTLFGRNFKELSVSISQFVCLFFYLLIRDPMTWNSLGTIPLVLYGVFVLLTVVLAFVYCSGPIPALIVSAVFVVLIVLITLMQIEIQIERLFRGGKKGKVASIDDNQ
jgi:hypothetical protein